MEKKKLGQLIISGGGGGGGSGGSDTIEMVASTSSAVDSAEDVVGGRGDSDTKRLLWRMEKAHAREQQLPQPEDEDDSGGGAESSVPSHVPSLPPRVARAQERMYPWLEPQSSCEGAASGGDQATVALLPKEVRSAPVWHEYNAIAAASVGGDSVVVVREEIQNARTRLLPPSASSSMARAASHDFWRAVNSTSSAPNGGRSSSSRGSRHSILRFGSSKLPRSANDRIRKSASVEFKLHEEDHLKHSASPVPSYTGLEIGRETPRCALVY